MRLTVFHGLYFITSNAFLKGLSLNFNILSLEANVVVPNIRAVPLNVSLAVTDCQTNHEKVSLLNNIFLS